MNDRTAFIAGTVVLGAIGLGYVSWRSRLRALPEAIDFDGGVSEDADALADELFEAGRLGRRILVPSVLLAGVLAAMILSGREAPAVAPIEALPKAFGFGSYL